jgi:hypothetical protein
MIYKLLSLFIVLAIIVPAQDSVKSNANVELPDFVITGKEVISVEQAKKIPPDFVSILSNSFIKPEHSPEELQLKEFPNPLKNNLKLFDSLNYGNGWLDAGIGSYFLPTAKLVYSSPFGNGVFEGRVTALNQRADVINSEKYSLSGGATLYYFLNSQLPLFNGTKFRFNGDLATSGYRLYGAFTNPDQKRNLNKGNFSFLINDLSNESFIYELNFSDELASLDKPFFSENLFGFDGYFKTEFSAFNLGLNYNYKRQYISNKLQNKSEFYFLSVQPTAGLNLSDILKVQFGLTYSQDGKNTFSAPYASAALHLEKNVTLFGEFAPAVEYLTENYFIRLNPYLNPDTFTNLFFEKSNVLKAVLKYEYGKYFEIDGGIKYYTSDEIPYFKNDIISGTFNVATVKGSSIGGFVNLLFHLGPFGIFYGTASMEESKDDANHSIPYYPKWESSLNYGYDFKMGFSTQASLYYTSKRFTDLINTQSLNSYIDLGLKFSYRIMQGFFITLEMNNLLNNENYNWFRYKDLPLNVTGGIRVTW